MIRWFILICCFLNTLYNAAFAFSPLISSGIEDSSNICPSESNPAGGSGGDFTPFPWGNEIPIAQDTLQGIWAATTVECGTYFAFEVRNNASKSQRIVKAKQFDPQTCTILSSGVGYELDRVFYISMVGQNGRSFDLTIRAFDRRDLKITNSGVPYGYYSEPPIIRSPYVVATLYPRREWSKRVSYPLVKISRSLRFKCANGDALPRDP